MLRDGHRVILTDGLSADPPPLTRRDVRLPGIAGKAFAVVGIRRSGKTTFLWQCLADRPAAGAPRPSRIFLGLEDDRPTGLQASDLAWLLDEYHRLHPHALREWPVALYLDEVQVVPDWELLCRRLMDTQRMSLFLSGSSAKLLSADAATTFSREQCPFARRSSWRREWNCTVMSYWLTGSSRPAATSSSRLNRWGEPCIPVPNQSAREQTTCWNGPSPTVRSASTPADRFSASGRSTN